MLARRRSHLGANAGIKPLFDAINVAYGAKEERGFFTLNAVSLTFTAGAIAFALLALVAVVVLPVSFHYVGLDAALEAILRYGRSPLIWLVIAFGLALLYRFGPTDSLNRSGTGSPGAAPSHRCCGSRLQRCFPGMPRTSEATTRPMAPSVRPSAS